MLRVKRKIDDIFGTKKLENDLREAVISGHNSRINDIVNGIIIPISLAGPNEGVYSFEVCYVGVSKQLTHTLEVGLLSLDSMGEHTFWDQRELEWWYHVDIEDVLYKGKCRIPNLSNILHKCHDSSRGDSYYLSDFNENNKCGYAVNHDGFILLKNFDLNKCCLAIFPYITLNIPVR